MAKGFSTKGFTTKAASVAPHIASVPGSGSRGRINQAAGQKHTSASGDVIGKSKPQAAGNMPVASGDDIVMPSQHPSAKTTRTTTKGGTL